MQMRRHRIESQDESQDEKYVHKVEKEEVPAEKSELEKEELLVESVGEAELSEFVVVAESHGKQEAAGTGSQHSGQMNLELPKFDETRGVQRHRSQHQN